MMRSSARTFLLSLLVVSCPFLARVPAVELWVSPAGDDDNPGTRERPFATPARALRQARELRRLNDRSVVTGVRIILREGVYPLVDPLFVRPEDSGTDAVPTIIAAAPDETPVFSGGTVVSGWRRVEQEIPRLPVAAQGNVWVSETPRFRGRQLECRQLWLNNRKAIRARAPNEGEMARLVRWDRAQQNAAISASLVGPSAVLDGTEMTVLQQWEIAVLRLKSVVIDGDLARVTFHAPEGRLEFEHPWPQPIMEPHGAPFFLAGAIEFLDQPGEWHQESSGRIYYWPRAGEDLTRDQVVVPALPTLVQVSGSLDRPVAHVSFQGIHFAHTSWLRPSRRGHVPLQAGMYLLDAYKLRPKGTPDWRSLDNQAWIGRPPAAVEVSGARHTSFLGCRFQHLAAAGIDYGRGTHDDRIEGCVFRDVGGNGIQMGCFQEAGIETHLPYDPADEREICTRERIANNLVTDCANEDWGCVGICVGYGREISIEHNEVAQLSYTGISLGWGWTRTQNAMRDNRVVANHVHHVATRMADSAGIYTLSAQPGTVIRENHVHSIQMSPYVHDPEHWFYLYLDEGSSFITVANNWCPEERFLANANGPGNSWEDNGPQVAESIKLKAGLEPEFRGLLTESPISGP